jgi:hypothetical protein
LTSHAQILENNARGFNPWILIGHRIATSQGEIPGEFPITIEYTPDQNIMGPNSRQFRTIQNTYGKNLQRLKNIPIYGNIKKLFRNNVVGYLPNFEQIYPLPLRVIIQLYPLNSMQFNLLNSLFTAVPLSIQYMVEYEFKKHRYDGLYVDLRFHSCNLSEILCEIENIVRYLKVKNYRVIPSIVNITKEEFTGDKHLKNYPNLFKSFIWKHNKFNNIKFLDRSGPLGYKERYIQLK